MLLCEVIMSKVIMQSEENKGEILERGNIYFFYRPKVTELTYNSESQEPIVKKRDEIQRFYLVLHPDNTKKYRLILVGEKKMPTIENKHEKNWSLVDLVTENKQELLQELDAHTYATKTRGERLLPAVRPVGEGVYCIVAHDRNTYLAYILELPANIGKAQKELDIEPEASYVITIKNPTIPGKRAAKSAAYPQNLKEKFHNLHFIPANPTQLLDYAGAELVLIGAQTDVNQELGIRIEKDSETINTADIFKDLKLWKKKHPITPLLEGYWA